MTSPAEEPSPESEPAEPGEHPATPARSTRDWRPSLPAVLALVMLLLVTAALTVTALVVYHRNERRLLNLRVRELNLVLAATAPATQTPLASAAELASATGGNEQKFKAFVAPYVGLGKQFASVSLWPLRARRLAPTAVVGAPPLLASMPREARQFFTRSARPGVLNVSPILGAPAHPSLGLGVVANPPSHGYAVYAESPLPANRRSRLERNTAFSDLNYVVYLGRSQRPSDVLATNLAQLPLTGRRARDVVPFGASAFTLVVGPKGSLGGNFFQDLPWIIAIGGVLIAIAVALVTERFAQRRHRAEQLAHTLDRVAAENRRLYTEQRSIAQTLQHALLPDKLPELDGLDVSARYVPAASGVDIGGDWYDVIAIGDRRVLLVIGDVSGHGLRAATTMALIRHAALAYVAEDYRPATVLAKLADFVEGGAGGYFATVLCALVDLDTHRVTIASAGHMAPLLVHDGRGEFLGGQADAPIGVARQSEFREATVSVPPSGTLIAFTDGLVERRGEVLDVGLERLRDLAIGRNLALDDLLAMLARDLTSDDHHDDTAIVGIQWRS